MGEPPSRYHMMYTCLSRAVHSGAENIIPTREQQLMFSYVYRKHFTYINSHNPHISLWDKPYHSQFPHEEAEAWRGLGCPPKAQSYKVAESGLEPTQSESVTLTLSAGKYFVSQNIYRLMRLIYTQGKIFKTTRKHNKKKISLHSAPQRWTVGQPPFSARAGLCLCVCLVLA